MSRLLVRGREESLSVLKVLRGFMITVRCVPFFFALYLVIMHQCFMVLIESKIMLESYYP